MSAKINPIINALTIDIEDYYQVSGFENHIKRHDWCLYPSRVEKNTNFILDRLEHYNIKATFFTLGIVAQQYPLLIKRIARDGHELASHGWEHIRATNQTPEEFFNDIYKTKNILEDRSGQQVLGYRAASFSISKHNLWAFEMMQKAGYIYSSSVNPIKHDHYGIPDAPRFSYQPIKNFWEFPITTIEFFGKRIPIGGGGYFRLMPYFIYKFLLQKLHNQDQTSSIFYFHPWEIDKDQPIIENLPFLKKFRHYVNLSIMSDKLETLYTDFNWGRMCDIFLYPQTNFKNSINIDKTIDNKKDYLSSIN